MNEDNFITIVLLVVIMCLAVWNLDKSNDMDDKLKSMIDHICIRPY